MKQGYRRIHGPLPTNALPVLPIVPRFGSIVYSHSVIFTRECQGVPGFDEHPFLGFERCLSFSTFRDWTEVQSGTHGQSASVTGRESSRDWPQSFAETHNHHHTQHASRLAPETGHEEVRVQRKTQPRQASHQTGNRGCHRSLYQTESHMWPGLHSGIAEEHQLPRWRRPRRQRTEGSWY